MAVDHGRVLYEGRSSRSQISICVTTRWCIVNGIHYPISQLGLIGLSRGRRGTTSVQRATGVAVVAGVLILTAVAVASGLTRKIWVALVVALLATAALTAVPSALTHMLRRPFQIWAQYGQSPVLLFDTYDSEQYGQVARALVRAREALDEAALHQRTHPQNGASGAAGPD